MAVGAYGTKNVQQSGRNESVIQSYWESNARQLVAEVMQGMEVTAKKSDMELAGALTGYRLRLNLRAIWPQQRFSFTYDTLRRPVDRTVSVNGAAELRPRNCDPNQPTQVANLSASEGWTSEMHVNSVRGEHVLHTVIGRRFSSVRRWVLDLGEANDELGHGITEMDFDGQALTIRPGPNEDYIVVEEGSVNPDTLDSRYFTEVDLRSCPAWHLPSGSLASVEIYSDGVEDVGVLFRFEGKGTLINALIDTDLVVANDESVFERDAKMQVVRRETITVGDRDPAQE